MDVTRMESEAKTMCGFIGIVHNNPSTPNEEKVNVLKSQNNIMTHRGPDDEGYFYDVYVSLGFRRLSIIDLDNCSQPLSYNNDKLWLVFSGEIYNYFEMLISLLDEGYEFAYVSDSEFIDALFTKHKENAFQYLRGMFSVLVWDKENETFYGARDPFGIKPLFYYETDEGAAFASEKKSIVCMLETEEVSEE